MFNHLIHKAVFHFDNSLVHVTMTMKSIFFVTGSLILITLHYLFGPSDHSASIQSAMDGSHSIKVVMEPKKSASKYSLLPFCPDLLSKQF